MDDVVVFDAGTSEDNGVLAGDTDPNVAEKAALLTPVPGGIGPITIAYLLHNLVSLAQQN
jgi:methylenetetrahydrofolate dehydrogenase (NADP+)/methenyltetrahydrofolate cyclohydrolase